MKSIILFINIFLVCYSYGQITNTVTAQSATSTHSVGNKQAIGYYQLGVKYKDGIGVAMDYAKAFDYFDKGAALGHAQCRYAKAYLLYKGLGCVQDYATAAILFREGARAGRDNSMYFYALCLRNGYGVSQNLDSAKYWLDSSAALGYKQAIRELATANPENKSESAKELLQTIHNLALPSNAPLNTFIKVPSRIPSEKLLTGRYKGYILQYDWSGSKVIDTRIMELELSCEGSRISGKWLEQDRDSFNFAGHLRGDSIAFTPSIHGRKDHYSPGEAIPYSINNAALSIEQSGGIVYLAGNVDMFSPQRKEPSKPIVLALSRNIDAPVIDAKFVFDKVYPNPFRDILNVNFSIGTTSVVSLSVQNAAGQNVYVQQGQNLSAGTYNYKLQLSRWMPSGMYFLLVTVNGKIYKYKVIHI